MKNTEFIEKFNDFKNKYEGKYINCLVLENKIKEVFTTNDSLFDSNDDIYTGTKSFYISLDDENKFVWINIVFHIAVESAHTFDTELFVEKVFID